MQKVKKNYGIVTVRKSSTQPSSTIKIQEYKYENFLKINF